MSNTKAKVSNARAKATTTVIAKVNEERQRRLTRNLVRKEEKDDE